MTIASAYSRMSYFFFFFSISTGRAASRVRWAMGLSFGGW